MKHFTKHNALIGIMLCLFFFGTTSTVCAASKLEMRHAYTMRHLKLDKATAAKFAPVLHKYLEERKAAGDKYDEVKDKYKDAIKAGTITSAQGKALMDAKLASEALELTAKKKYYPEFLKVLKADKVFLAFEFANDKKSKIEADR